MRQTIITAAGGSLIVVCVCILIIATILLYPTKPPVLSFQLGEYRGFGQTTHSLACSRDTECPLVDYTIWLLHVPSQRDDQPYRVILEIKLPLRR